MPLPTPSAFPDCDAAFRAALTHGTIHLDFPDRRRATTFAARCNRFRKSLRESAAAVGQPPTSPYDGIIIRHPGRGKRLIFEPRLNDFTIQTPDGTPIDPAAAPASADPKEVGDFADFLEDFTASLPPLPETSND